MVKRSFLTFVALTALSLAYLLTLLPLVILASGLAGKTYTLSVLIWGFFVLLSLIPVLSLIIRNIWFFEGKGESIPTAHLRELLLAINAGENPVQVEEKRKKLLVTWRYQDDKWCRYMQATNIKKLYELRLSFHAPTKTVYLSDRVRPMEILICTTDIKKGFFPRLQPFFKVHLGPQWNISLFKERSELDYRFQPREIKSPIMGTILENGWNVRFTLL